MASSTSKKKQNYKLFYNGCHFNIPIDWTKIAIISPTDSDTVYVNENLPGKPLDGTYGIRQLNTALNGFEDFNRHSRNIKTIFFGFPAVVASRPVIITNLLIVELKSVPIQNEIIAWLDEHGMEMTSRDAGTTIEIQPKANSNANIFEIAEELKVSGLVQYVDFNLVQGIKFF